MNVDAARAWVLNTLGVPYAQATLNDFGSVIVHLPETLVVCKFRETSGGDVVVVVDSPVLLEVPATAELYELLAISDVSFPFGSFSVGAGDSDATLTIGFSAKMFVDDLPPEHLLRAVVAISSEAVHQTRYLQPVVGGFGIYNQP